MKFILLIASSLILLACASEPTKTNYYLLRSDIKVDTSREMDAGNIRLATVGVANYIDQAGLVLEEATGQIVIARSNLWAEPLRNSLKSFLATEISPASGQTVQVGRRTSELAKIRLDVSIDQLHGTADGRALLVAYWTVSNKTEQGVEKKNYYFSKALPLESDGYDALVASEKQLLSDLASEISKVL